MARSLLRRCSMGRISQLSTAVPSHQLSQEAAAAAVARSLSLPSSKGQALQDLFERAEVSTRYCALDPCHLGEKRSLSQTMALYRQHAEELAVTATQRCLSAAGVEPREIDLVIGCSCTGMLLPSLSVLIAQRLGLRSDVRRMPITEAGCAGGAYSLARAHDYVRAFPHARVLVITVELPSLTMQHDDSSSANIVACALFGDGAAAALVEGANVEMRSQGRVLEITGTHTEVFPDSLEDLGFDLREGGLHIVLSPHVPRIVAENAPAVVEGFLAQAGLSTQDLAFFVLHPGGRKVLDALSSSLELSDERTRVSRDVLRAFGNQSSASVMFVLEQTLAEGSIDGFGLLAAFGPGITMELCQLHAFDAKAASVEVLSPPERRSSMEMIA